MNTPTAALVWEFWRRHRKRLLIIGGIILGFALVYPKLCARAGFSAGDADAFDNFVARIDRHRPPSVVDIVHALYTFGLLCGPEVCFVLTLLCMIWMFTWTASDPKTKDPMAFFTRLFTLPVSTPFLFWRLFLSGQAAIILLYISWTRLVPMPPLEMFMPYENCFGWMTLLAVTQGITWALAGWPITRMLTLVALLMAFFFVAAERHFMNPTLLLSAVFLVGLAGARMGLQKMRHGQWQGANWALLLGSLRKPGDMHGPRQFSSPEQAQAWFEWRRFARRLCFFVGAFTLGPVVVQVLTRYNMGWGPIQTETLSAFVVILLVMPLFFFWSHVLPVPQPDMPFVMNRPVTNGQMMMATLKAAGLGAIVSWALALLAICGLPFLGDFQAAQDSWPIPPQARVFIVVGLVFLTWRMVAVNLFSLWSGSKSLGSVPVYWFLGLYVCAFAISILSQDEARWEALCRAVPVVLVILLVVKFLLAFAVFRVSIKRRLIDLSSVVAYLRVWFLLAAAFLTVALILFHNGKANIEAPLAIVLLIPLNRIGLCPITLAWNRHQ